MQDNKILTVITPVYNCEEFIEETIRSVLFASRNYNCEYILVNDGSTDNTKSLIESFGSQVKIINQENCGESQAINNALSTAEGKYCLIVSADDPLPDSDLLHLSFEILNSSQSTVVTYPDWTMIDSNGNAISMITTDEYSEQTLIGKFKCIPGPGAIFRTDLARQVGGRNPLYKFVGDYDFWLKLSRHGKFQRIPYNLAQWRYHNNSTSINLRGFRMANERILVIRNFLAEHKIDPQLSKSARAHSYYLAAMLSYFTREVPGREWIFKALHIYGKWIPGVKIKVVIFLVLFPYSFHVVEVMRKNRILRRLIPQG